MEISPEQVRKDAEAVYDVIMDGGIALVPLDVAYAIIGHKEEAIKKIFAVKKRSFEKPSGMFACMDHSLALHELGKREREIQQALFYEHNLPFSVVAPLTLRTLALPVSIRTLSRHRRKPAPWTCC